MSARSKQRHAEKAPRLTATGRQPTRDAGEPGGGTLLALAAAVFGCAAAVRAATPIPSDKRIEGTIVRTLAVPTTQPMHMPTDVAVDRRGRVFVADGANNRIVRFTKDGVFDAAIASPGGHALGRPIGVTVDSSDRLWITDTGHHSIVITSPDGEAIDAFQVPQPNGGRPSNPTDVAVTADGNHAYVVDSNNHRIIIRDNRTGQLSPMGRFGRALGQFAWPFMTCIAPDGNIYISETIGARAQRLSPTGRWAGQVPPSAPWGVELGQFYRPKGIAADALGRIFIGDSSLGVIQVFGPRGEALGVLTNAEGELLRFRHPMGLCFDADGTLYVVELGADRVAVVSLRRGSTPPTTSPTRDGAGGGR